MTCSGQMKWTTSAPWLKFVKLIFHGHVFCSALQVSVLWQKLEFLTEKKRATNDAEGEGVEEMEEEVFEME